ncbi:MAG: hypothetical protein ACRYFU_24170 [Janthinobacterium lividum]
MRVLTKTEAINFAAQVGLEGKFSHLSPELSRTEFTTDVGRRYAYAQLLTDHLFSDQCSVVCLDITAWAVWPSIQNMDLFYSYRRSLGESRRLIDAHFHVFACSEAKEFRNILHRSLISLFDVAGASTTTDFRFYASHNEWIDLAWQEDAPWTQGMRYFFEQT